jgi:hypothetical protein
MLLDFLFDNLIGKHLLEKVNKREAKKQFQNNFVVELLLDFLFDNLMGEHLLEKDKTSGVQSFHLE